VWTDSAWLREAQDWIDGQLERIGVAPAGAVEQSHIEPWSTAIRVPVDGGDLWFKANMPALTSEAAVIEILGRRRPGSVPDLRAIDHERGWMLMADAGTPLRDVVASARDLRGWLNALPQYAQLQLDAVDQVGELLTVGVPDRRLDTLPAEYERLLGVTRNMTGEERTRLDRLRPRVREMCEELAAFGISETIQHNDLHDGQVFIRGDDYRFLDWAEACISHPFFTMAVTLEGVIAWGVDDIRGSADVGPFRDAYLEPFTTHGTSSQLRSALATALRLGWICRALEVQRWVTALDPEDRAKHLDGVALRLRMFLSGLP
jgi:Phosphotransferase enzyme family